MHILLIGATGRTGQPFVEQALEAGHTIAAIVRNPDDLLQADRVDTFRGDAREPYVVQHAVEAANYDAIVIAVAGGLKRDHTNEDVTRNVIRTVKETGQRPHLWVVSACGTANSYEQLSFVGRLIKNTLLRHPFADHEVQERLVRTSGLPYTIVRPVGLTEGPLTKTGYVAKPTGRMPSTRISRADVAHYMLTHLTDETVESLAVSLSNK